MRGIYVGAHFFSISTILGEDGLKGHGAEINRLVSCVLLVCLENSLVLPVLSAGPLTRTNDDVIKWKYSSALLALCAGNSSYAELWFSLWPAPEVWVNNRESGDLRRYRAHYDVTVTNNIARAVQVPARKKDRIFNLCYLTWQRMWNMPGQEGYVTCTSIQC